MHCSAHERLTPLYRAFSRLSTFPGQISLKTRDEIAFTFSIMSSESSPSSPSSEQSFFTGFWRWLRPHILNDVSRWEGMVWLDLNNPVALKADLSKGHKRSIQDWGLSPLGRNQRNDLRCQS